MIEIRNRLYDNLPKGEVSVFDFIKVIKEHLTELDLLIDSLTAPEPEVKTPEQVLLELLKQKIKTTEGDSITCYQMMMYLYNFFNPETCMKYTIQAMELYASQFKTNLTKTPDAG